MAGNASELSIPRLEKAIQDGDIIRARQILAARTVETDGLTGYALLRTAARKDNVVFLQNLVEAGVDVNARSGAGDTALMEAVRYGHRDNIDYLLSKGTNASLKNSSDETAASIAEEILERNILTLMSQALYGVLRDAEQRLVDKWEGLTATLKQAEADAVSVALQNKLSVRKPLRLKRT